MIQEPQFSGAPTAKVSATGVIKTMYWDEGQNSTALIFRFSTQIFAKLGGLRDLGVNSKCSEAGGWELLSLAPGGSKNLSLQNLGS